MSATRSELIFGLLLVAFGLVGMVSLFAMSLSPVAYECTPIPPKSSEWREP